MTQDGAVTGEGFTGGTSHRLDRAAAAVSEDASSVGQWHVDRLRAEFGPDVTAEEARDALERQGVRVAELPMLPVDPPALIAADPDYLDRVARLGRKLSVQLVSSHLEAGFALHADGVRLAGGSVLDAEAIEAARKRNAAGTNSDDAEYVLSVLAAAAGDPHGLVDLVLWEVVQKLRELAELDYPQRTIAGQAARLALERGQAEVLAAAVIEERERRRSPGRPVNGFELPEHRALALEAPRAAAPEPARPAEKTAPPGRGSRLRWPLQPVTDLRTRSMPGRSDLVQLSWSAPPDGIVCLRAAPEPPRGRPERRLTRETRRRTGGC